MDGGGFGSEAARTTQWVVSASAGRLPCPSSCTYQPAATLDYGGGVLQPYADVPWCRQAGASGAWTATKPVLAAGMLCWDYMPSYAPLPGALMLGLFMPSPSNLLATSDLLPTSSQLLATSLLYHPSRV